MGREDGQSSSGRGQKAQALAMAHGNGKLARLPSALEVVLQRLSIVDAHQPKQCTCPACTREGDARKVDPPWVFVGGLEVAS